MDEFEFSPSDVTLKNMSLLAEKISVLEELRILEISEIARFAAKTFSNMSVEGYGLYEIFSQISSTLNLAPPKSHSYCLRENRKTIFSFMESLSVYDKASFVRLFFEHLDTLGIKLGERDFFSPHSGSETVAFVNNPLAHEAFDVFSQDMSDPRLKYTRDMKETVQVLSDGTVDFAILPLEERGGTRLHSVTELIFKEDLKINSVTPVFGAYGGADMKYALVSKYMSVPEIRDEDDRYLEICLKREGELDISSLLSLASALDIELYRITSRIFETDDGDTPYYSVVLKREGGDFSEYLAYLTLFAENYISVGIYKNLE